MDDEARLTGEPKRSLAKRRGHSSHHLLSTVFLVMAIAEMSRTVGRHYTTLSNVALSSTSLFTVNAFQPMARTGTRTGRKLRLQNVFSRRASTISDDEPAAQSSYDMVVVGGGSAGLTAAKFASGTLKKSVLIVDEERLGGDCTWTGCVPSKSLLSQAKASKMARNYAIQQHVANNNSGSEEGVDESLRSKSRANFSKVQEYFRTVQESIYEEDDSPKALEKFGIETIEGQKARLVSPTKLSFNKGSTTTTVEATEGILLCTGAKPNRPTFIPGLTDIDYLTYEEIWTRDFGDALPQKWTIIGGGPIGCELAQALSRLGASVTIVTGSSGRLLPSVDDAEVSELMKQVFEEDENIQVVQGKLSKVEPVPGESASSHVAHVETTSKESVSVEGEAMLLSIGRKPNTSGLGLETLGIELDSNTGGIAVDSTLKTTVNGIYAAGDCTGDKQFTHYAGYQGAVAARNILLPFTDPGKLGNDVPTTTFTSPEVATIGYSEAAAKAEFGEKAVSVSSLRLDEVDRAVCDNATKGIIKVVYSSKGKKKILGATIMAPVAGELISEISVAMNAGMGFPGLAKAVHPYPSYAFALQAMAAEIYYEDVGKYRWVYNILKKLGL